MSVRSSPERGVSPVLGVVLLVALTAMLAGTAGLAFQSAADAGEPPPRVRFEVTATPDGRVTLHHGGGDVVDASELRIRIAVDGDRLAHQPPVPYFAADGFRAGPTGPLNRRADHRWSAGETATIRVASTNDPTIGPGSRVRVWVYAEDAEMWRGSTVARSTTGGGSG